MGKNFWLLMVLFWSGCFSQSGGERMAQGGQANEQVPDAPVFDEGLPPTNWYWDKMIPGSITINSNTKTIVYLRGRGVHSFLVEKGNHLGDYCLVASFEEQGLKHQLRFRVVPLSLAQGSVQEKIFRVDLSLAQEGELLCEGKVTRYDSRGIVLGEVDSSINGDSVGYFPEELCSSCSGVQNASHLALYRAKQGGGIEDSTVITISELDMTSLGLRFDMSNQRLPGNEGGSCSLGNCRAKGFDCCLDKQCVLDGEMRPGVAASYPEELAQAMEEEDKKNYPHLFFLCSLGGAMGSVEGEEENRPIEEERARSARYRLDYLCLEADDVREGECSKSSHDSPALCHSAGERWTYFCRVGECSLRSQQSRGFCEGAGGVWSEYLSGEENGTEEAKDAIQKRVWERCGCKGEDCEGYGLKAKKNSLGEILSVECKFPEPEIETILQYLNVDIPTRSVPHRFFKASDGESVDELSDLNLLVPSERTLEGEPFYYLTPVDKQGPQGNSFNMNAILGQLSTDVFGALPAKMLEVENGQVYVIRTTQGIYTPCPTCSVDAWESNFLPFPPSKNGVGLQALGYINNRSEFQNNIHRGNYEDTLFGRACWVPPTMIPFTHQKRENISNQRSIRLKTQSALYVNGYRRDWYGFNLGAVIGSFDGVKWFAVGTGRRVLATSNKLFLAINAPFGDLAVATNLAADVVPDIGGESVASHDYNPAVGLDHPEQNQGGSCQYWHQCKVDSDCVTKLGWEYVCADINNYGSQWPLFDINGKEKVNRELETKGFSKILQDVLPVGEKKRCVYRGSGAVCKRDVNNDLLDKSKKLFQCAPNLYCASLRSNQFNDGIVRTPQSEDPFVYGQERDVLGRPQSYVGATKALDNDIISNLQYNFSLHSDALEDMGICRPGKNLNPTDLLVQHSDKDGLGRVDYINQISSCDSNALGATVDDRVATCPIFQTEDEAAESKGDYITDRIDIDYAHKQNRCGGDIQWDDGSGLINSFAGLELDRLNSVGRIDQPSLVVDACSRRAGAVCFTDLDCSPNMLHSEKASYLGERAFGNTRAEMLYWSEPLICGQAQSPPGLNSKDYDDYDPGKNRCCRPIGEELTMFTQDDDSIIEDNVASDAGVLNAIYFPFLIDTLSPEDGFYSRYVQAGPELRSGFQMVPYPEVPMVRENRIPKSFQWKSVVDTGEATCCGGTWVRKFADGGNDWSNNQRLQMDPVHFSCLNYSSELYREAVGFADADNYRKHANKMCLAPGDSGCIQSIISRGPGFAVIPPDNLVAAPAILNTTPTDVPGGGGDLLQDKSFAVPFMPIPYPTPTPLDPDNNIGPFNFFASPDYDGVSIYFPHYIGGWQNIRRQAGRPIIQIDYYDVDGDGNRVFLSRSGILANAGTAACVAANNSNARALPAEESYCLAPDAMGVFQIMHVRAAAPTPANDWEYAGIRMEFNVPGTNAFCYDRPGVDANCPGGGVTVPGLSGMSAGNELYYLTKLGRLELLGIPQIWYEPLYCNSNRELLVEGIFSPLWERRSDFESVGNGFVYNDTINGRGLNELYDPTFSGADVSNSGGRVVFQDKVTLPKVFSGHKFMCCLGVGEIAENGARCCSGYAREQEESEELTCALPTGANLHVYFNRFVSNDGRGEEQPGGGLVDEDFIPETGEPKNEQEVYNKLWDLGEAYCQNGSVRKGGAFGEYRAQPNDGFYVQLNQSEEAQKYPSIVDDPNDWDDHDNGYSPFLEGFRWNHHIYCN